MRAAMIRLNFHIPSALLKKLDALARKAGITRAEYLRAIIAQHVNSGK